MTATENVQAQPPQPQVIIVREERESLISRGIGSAFAPVVFFSGAIGMAAGALAGAGQTGSGTGLIIGAFVGGTVTATAATLGVKAIQLGADFALNTAFFVLKLPFRATACVLNGVTSGLNFAYEAIAGSNPVENGTNDSDQDILKLREKIA